MHIDKSLAQGLASRTFDSVVSNTIDAYEKLEREASAFSTRPTTAKGARRLLAKLKPHVATHAFAWQEGKTRHDGPYLGWLWFGAAGYSDDSIVLGGAWTAPTSKSFKYLKSHLAIFSKHAVARGHQRLGKVLWEEIKEDFEAASPMIWLFYMAQERLGLQQVFLPSSNGLFAGSFTEDQIIEIRTFINFDDNLAQKWKDTKCLVEEMKERFPEQIPSLVSQLLHPVPEWPYEVLDWFLDKLKSGRFGWLKDPYQRKADPLGDAWDSHVRGYSNELN